MHDTHDVRKSKELHDKEMNWLSRQLAKKEIKKLNRKVKSLTRDLERCENRRSESLVFEYEFRKLLVRFEKREWKSEWPFERFLEAIIHLKESLP